MQNQKLMQGVSNKSQGFTLGDAQQDIESLELVVVPAPADTKASPVVRIGSSSGNANCWQRACDKVKQTKPRA